MPLFRGNISQLFALTASITLFYLLAPAAEGDQHPKIRQFSVITSPPGAEVYIITGKAGETPVTLSEREVYPNWYPDEKASMYGKIVLKRSGCKNYSKQLTLTDVSEGVRVTLDCKEKVSHVAEKSSLQEFEPVSKAATETETFSAPSDDVRTIQRRMQQLLVLEQLFEDGFITADEERSIRKRILTSPR